jgi:hypothetical protein
MVRGRHRPGAAINEVTAACVGDHLALHVNGESAADVRDGPFASLKVGLIAATFEEGGVEMHFADFVVYRPQARLGRRRFPLGRVGGWGRIPLSSDRARSPRYRSVGANPPRFVGA